MHVIRKQRLIWGLPVVLVLSGLIVWGAVRNDAQRRRSGMTGTRCPGDGYPQRIVSLAPSITEILFSLQLGDRIVGVTRYCDYPASAKALPQVGGYVDPNYEAIVSLRPDLVILLTSHRDAKVELEKMGFRTLTTPQYTVNDVHEAIRLIGECCGVPEKAGPMLDSLATRTRAVRHAIEGKAAPRVLVCIGRDTASGKLAGMYIAGRNGLYDDIIEMAGGANAYRDEKVGYPQLSADGVLQLDPDVIIDLVTHITPGGETTEQIARQWDPLRPVKAVRNRRVHVIVGTHALRPGPRYIEFLEQVARLLHPEAFGKEPSHE